MEKKKINLAGVPIIPSGYLESFPLMKEEYFGTPSILSDPNERGAFTASFSADSPEDWTLAPPDFEDHISSHQEHSFLIYYYVLRAIRVSFFLPTFHIGVLNWV